PSTQPELPGTDVNLVSTSPPVHDSATAILARRSSNRPPTTSSSDRPSTLKAADPTAATSCCTASSSARSTAAVSALVLDKCSSICPDAARIVVSIGVGPVIHFE